MLFPAVQNDFRIEKIIPCHCVMSGQIISQKIDFKSQVIFVQHNFFTGFKFTSFCRNLCDLFMRLELYHNSGLNPMLGYPQQPRNCKLLLYTGRIWQINKNNVIFFLSSHAQELFPCCALFYMFINRSIKRSKTNLHDVNLIFNSEKVILDVKESVAIYTIFEIILKFILALIELLTKQVQSFKNFKRTSFTFLFIFFSLFCQFNAFFTST